METTVVTGQIRILITLISAVLLVLSLQFGFAVYRQVTISHCVAAQTGIDGNIGVGGSTYCLAH